MRLVVATASVVFVVGALLAACSAPSSVDEFVCRPDGLFPDPHCQTPDAGTDADADTDDITIDTDAGAQAIQCSGRCVPEPSSESAGDWPRTPMFLWIGPRELAPESCDEARQAAGLAEDVVFFEKYRRFADLIAPPAECEPCPCPKSEGTCEGLPASIEVRAGTCAESGATSLPFGGPPGWDGSCTNAHALPAGTQCDGEPCAQSIEASALPGPTSESCPTVTTPPPAFKVTTDWATAGVACEAKELHEACPVSTFHCMHHPPLPWRQCVALAGVHETCPGNYTHERYVLYGEEPKDARGCSTCECGGKPIGSACVGALRLYQDGACTQQTQQTGISSFGKQCSDVQPPGRALGSKAITDLAYYPGLCASVGGAPTGDAEIDVEQAVTFCCLSPFYISPPK